jgi:hypothetical protein
VVAGFAGIEGAYDSRSDMIVNEYIKVDPTKHCEELLAALPTLPQMK